MNFTRRWFRGDRNQCIWNKELLKKNNLYIFRCRTDGQLKSMSNELYTITSVVFFIGLTERLKSERLFFEISRETITRLRRKRVTGLSFVSRLTGRGSSSVYGGQGKHNDTVYYYFIFEFSKLDCRTTNARHRRPFFSTRLFRYNHYCCTPAHVL